jgi:hypothetical protein
MRKNVRRNIFRAVENLSACSGSWKRYTNLAKFTLHEAASSVHEAEVQLLLEEGAHIEAKVSSG